jgi:hypothetical protein
MTHEARRGPMSTGTRSGTPQVLLGHHLRQLKLPTILREYDICRSLYVQSWAHCVRSNRMLAQPSDLALPQARTMPSVAGNRRCFG